MKKSSKLFWASFLLVLIVGCTGNKSKDQEASTAEPADRILHIDLEPVLQKEGVEPLSSIASDILYIPLETKALLNRINVVAWKDSYLIYDLYNLYLYDNTGKFVKQIGRRGNGPSDNLQIGTVIPDPSTGDFYIFDIKKMIKRDQDANYVDNMPIGDYFTRGIYTPDETILLNNLNTIKLYSDTTIAYSLIEIDASGVEKRKYINHSPRYGPSLKWAYGNSIMPLYLFSDEVRFLDFGNDTLVTVAGGTTTPYAIFDLGKMKTDYAPDLSQIDPRQAIQFLNDLLGLAILDLFENKDFFILLLVKGLADETKYHVSYNKKNGELKLLKEGGFSNDFDGGITFFPKRVDENGDMIVWKSAEDFKEEILSKDYTAQKAKYGERFEKVYQFAQSLKEDDNPVLIVAKKK